VPKIPLLNLRLNKGQFVDSAPVYLSEKVAEFNMRGRRSRLYDEIFEVEVRKETLLSTEQSIQQNVAKFAESLGVKNAGVEQ
jgi:hypothetical protein